MQISGEEKQIKILKKISGSRRVEIGAELYEMAREIAKAGIRDQFPGLSNSEVEEKLKERLAK